MTLDEVLGQLSERLISSGVFEMGDGFDLIAVAVRPKQISSLTYLLDRDGIRLGRDSSSRPQLTISGTEERLIELFMGVKMPQQMFLRREVELSGRLEFAQRLWRIFDGHSSDFDLGNGHA